MASELVSVTVADGKYTIREKAPYKWECLRYGEHWPAFDINGPDNLHIALAHEVDRLRKEAKASPAPTATDTGLVTPELRQEIFELAKDLFWRVDGNQRLWSSEEREIYGLRAAMQITRSQAEAIIAAKDARIAFLERVIADQETQIVKQSALEADNAAQAVRIKELEAALDSDPSGSDLWRYWSRKACEASQKYVDEVDRAEALEAKLAAAEKALEAARPYVEDYDTRRHNTGVDETLTQIDAVLGGKP